MKFRQILLIPIIPLAGTPTAAMGDIFEPFVTANLSPFVQVHNLPSARSADLSEKGEWRLRITAETGNNFTAGDTADETITLDGETSRNQLSVSYGITDRWELSVTIPHVAHDGGSLDSFIEDWHKFFGLPNGNRESAEQDLLNYQWRSPGNPQVTITDSRQGLGDIGLRVAYQVRDNESRSVSLVGGATLPTGDAEDLLGSGSTTVFTGLYLSQRGLLGKRALTLHGSAGAMFLGDSDLPGVNDWLGYGSISLVWQRWERVALKTQVSMHSAVYDSDLKELGHFAAQLSLGGTIALTARTFLDIGVIEDIVTDTSPDVVFHFSLRQHF